MAQPNELYELHMAAGGLPDFVVHRAAAAAASRCLPAAYLHRRSVRDRPDHCCCCAVLCCVVLCAVRV